MIWRIRERAAFDRLGRDGKRIRATPHPTQSGSGASRGSAGERPPVWCSYLPDFDGAPPRVGFAIGRAVGPAVVRNRLRRRCRSVLRDLEASSQLAPGWYLFGARPAAGELTFDQLSEILCDLAGGARELAARQQRQRARAEHDSVVVGV